jgi:UDP-N-acetylmuramoylalanine--D-glutamate ligase
VHWFSRRIPATRGAWLDRDAITIAAGRPRALLETAELRVPGAHVIENALAALAAAVAVGVDPDAAAGVLRAFRGLPYRFRLAATRDDVAFYEDSLGTNPTAASAAISGMTRRYHLIAGGLRKGAQPDDFAPMVRALAATPARAVYVIGSAAEELAAAIGAMDRPPTIVRAGTLEAAMAAAWDAAEPGEAVLLSPGCESFDQFADYRERGDRFAALIRTLPRRARGENVG